MTSHDTFMTSALNDIGTLAQNHMWSFLEHAVREWQLTTVIPGDLVAQMEHGRPRCRALAAWRTTSQPNPMPSAGGSERDGERERETEENRGLPGLIQRDIDSPVELSVEETNPRFNLWCLLRN